MKLFEYVNPSGNQIAVCKAHTIENAYNIFRSMFQYVEKDNVFEVSFNIDGAAMVYNRVW